VGPPVHPLLWWSHPSKSHVWVVFMVKKRGGKLPFTVVFPSTPAVIGQFYLEIIGEQTFVKEK